MRYSRDVNVKEYYEALKKHIREKNGSEVMFQEFTDKRKGFTEEQNDEEIDFLIRNGYLKK